MIDSNTYPKRYIEDIHTTEKEKNSEWYLKQNIDYWISTLVIERPYLSTYRNYYNGIRNEKEFEYLSEAFDLGTPSKLMFTPIIKPRIDALLGQIQSDKHTYSVVPVGDRVIDSMLEEKRQKIIADTEKALDSFIDTVRQLGDKQIDTFGLENTLNDITESYNSDFLTDYEIAAQTVLKYFSESPTIGMREKLRDLALDILTTGEGHYRIYVSKIGKDPELEIIKPENIFYNKNTNSQFLDGVYAVVHREFMTDKEILARYGRQMTKDQVTRLFGNASRDRGGVVIRSGKTIEADAKMGDTGRNTITSQRSGTMLNTTAVYHVEWLAYSRIPIDENEESYKTVEGKGGKIRYGERMDRFEGTRIGNIYLNAGKSLHTYRSSSAPGETKLSYNSIFYNDRNGAPYSIVGAMKDLQDLYDITTFYRDTLVASAGVQGDRINIAAIPKVLGTDFMDRLFKFIKIKKMGYELIDPTEPGAQYFNNYGSFDNSVSGNSLKSLNDILTMIENQANIVAGTSPQMLAQIAERDAVGNVRQGLKQSMMINLDLFNLIRAGIKRISTDMLACAQIAYKGGKKLSYIAGNKSYVYEILPENFTDVDYSIYVSYSLDDSGKLDNLRLLAEKLIDPRKGGVSADVLVKAVMTDSATEAVRVINNGIKESKKEDDQLQQAMEQLNKQQEQMKELQKQLSDYDKELKKAKASVDQYKQQELALKGREIDYKYNTDSKEVDRKIKKDKEEAAVKSELVDLERAQLYLGNGPEKTTNKQIAK